ncbi:hypothetical protein Golob_012550, partial [Gossypium lobatum]|nr:hypothetical protein [Gossypium lobatum]
MASGWGINGTKGRCYDFWVDFSECMSRCREPKDCALLREDYLECLHHSKEVRFLHFKCPPNILILFITTIGASRDLNCGRSRVFGRIVFIAVVDITDAIAVIA